MNTTLTFELIGLDALETRLRTLTDEALNERDILDEAGAALFNRIRTDFLNEIDPDGNPWVPSKAGLARRAHGGTGTLFDTGRLFHSLQLYATGDDERAIGTNVEYAQKLQQGGWFPFDNPKLAPQPPRVFLGFGEEDSLIVERIVQTRIQQALGS